MNHRWSEWINGRRMCLHCDKVESMTPEEWDEYLRSVSGTSEAKKEAQKGEP